MSTKSLLKLSVAASVVVGGILVGSPKAFGSFNYGTYAGSNFTYNNITESDTIGSSTSGGPLFGSPIGVGNALVFSPQNFVVSSNNGAGSTGPGSIALEDGHLSTLITANGSATIDQITINEAGDYSLSGVAVPNDDTFAKVGGTVFLTILSLNTNPSNFIPIQTSANLVFTPHGGGVNPNGGTYDLATDAGTGVIWTGTLGNSIDQAIMNAGYVGNATEVLFTMDNTLTANSQANTSAFIEKKQADAVTLTTSVPEPLSTGWAALTALALLKRSRKV